MQKYKNEENEKMKILLQQISTTPMVKNPQPVRLCLRASVIFLFLSLPISYPFPSLT